MPHDTKSEVEKVQDLKKRHLDLVDPIFQAIGALSGFSNISWCD